MAILIIEDDLDTANILEDIIISRKQQAFVCGSIKKAKDLLKVNDITLAFVDYRLEDGISCELIKYIKEHYPKTSICFMSATTNFQSIVEKLPVNFHLNKPFSLDDIDEIIKHSTNH